MDPKFSGWLEGYERRPDSNFAPQRRPPQGIVFHSGDQGQDLADAALAMPISYHFAWDTAKGREGRFAQLVSTKLRAYHAGAEGNDWIGIALSGPWSQNPRSEHEREETRRLVSALVERMGVKYWCRHSEITKGKKDPGPGFSGGWLDGLGLVHSFPVASGRKP